MSSLFIELDEKSVRKEQKKDEEISTNDKIEDFGKPNSSDLGLIATNILTCIFSSGLFVFPLFFRTYGVVLGCYFAIFANVLNYWTSSLIYEVSVFTKKNSMLEMINELFEKSVFSLFKVTFFLDYFSNYLISLLFSWSILQFIMYNIGLIHYQNAMTSTGVELHCYTSQIMFYRLLFVIGAFLIVTPVLLKKSNFATKFITICYFTIFGVFILFTIFDLKSYSNYYFQKKSLIVTNYKEFSMDYFRFSFMLLTSLYIQPSLLTIKKELPNVSPKHLQSTVQKTFILITFVCVTFGLYCYWSLGDLHTHDLFMLRTSFPGRKGEGFYLILLASVSIFNLFYIRFYHANMVSYLQDTSVYFKDHPYMTILPWILSLLVVFLYPKIIQTLGYLACTVFLLNGYILPMIMKIKLNRRRQEPIIKNAIYIGLIMILFVISIISLTSIFEFQS